MARQAWERGLLGACPSRALWDGQGNTNLSKSWIWDYSPVNWQTSNWNNNSTNSPKHRPSTRPEGMGDGDPHNPDMPTCAASVHFRPLSTWASYSQPQQPFGPHLSSSLYSLLRHWCVVLRVLLGGLAPIQFATVALERGCPVPST